MLLHKYLIVALLPVIAACGSGGSGGDDDSGGGVEESTSGDGTVSVTESRKACVADTSIGEAMLKAINEVRATGYNCGGNVGQMPPAPPVTWNDQVFQAAETHAIDMATNDFLGHTGTNGLEHPDRLTNTGYDWMNVGENLARTDWASELEPTKALSQCAWLGSPNHCRNIMNPNFTEMGLSCIDDGEVTVYAESLGQDIEVLRTYWALVMARPK